jgi:truncated hemoglobin YjbI
LPGFLPQCFSSQQHCRAHRPTRAITTLVEDFYADIRRDSILRP